MLVDICTNLFSIWHKKYPQNHRSFHANCTKNKNLNNPYICSNTLHVPQYIMNKPQ